MAHFLSTKVWRAAIVFAALLFFAPELFSQCNPDLTPPTVQAPADVTVSCESFDPSLVAYGTATANDDCCLDQVVVTKNYTLFDTICNKGTITRVFQAFDCSGNSSTLGVATAMQTIVVTYEQDYYIKFPNDLILTALDPNNSDFGTPVMFKEDCELIGVSFEDFVLLDQPDAAVLIERTWTIINWCTYDPNLPAIVVPNPSPNITPNSPANLPGPTVSAPGTPAPWASTIVKITPSDPTPTDFSTFWNANANAYRYTQIIKLVDTFFVAVHGRVFSDTSANCSYETGEDLLGIWTVRVTGDVSGAIYEANTDTQGEYVVVMDGVDTSVTVTLVAASNFGQNCQSEYTVQTEVGEVVEQDIPVHLEERCGLLSVGVSTARLRRCFDNRYTVQACNLSSEAIPNAYVEVSLDDYFDYINSSIPGLNISGNTWSFQLGDLPAGDCRWFTIDFNLSCEAPIGTTHCTEANIFPYDDCRGNSNWSGADVDVSVLCDGDSIRFAITNVGDASMTESLDFVVVEDVVMRQEGNFQLGIGESLQFAQLANGNTWRLEAQEEPLHPWGGPQAAALEGCGGVNNFGLINLFPISNASPFEALDCRENIGSFDPNDKQGFPVGYGPEHFIKANTDIEYLIRFQNTGTDTAFTVVVLDTLAPHFEPTSVRVQVASHPMTFAMLEGNVLRFTFDNILLPDSNVNLLGSNGFIKFRVSQKPDLADGILLENTAAIYFDFNEPVITNTTFHTVGEHFVPSVSTDEPKYDGLLRAYPNPAADGVFFDLKDWANAGVFRLSNPLGQQVSLERFAGKQFRLERKNLPAGIYHFQIMSGDVPLASGKIVFK